MTNMKVKVINRSPHGLPQYETAHAAGLDLRADLPERVVIKPMERVVVPTGLYVELPEGVEMQTLPKFHSFSVNRDSTANMRSSVLKRIVCLVSKSGSLKPSWQYRI